MTGKEYTMSVIVFSILSLIFLLSLQMLQYLLPLNPEKLSNIFWDLAFNTEYSFITNTNWKAYSGGSSLSYLTQMIGFTL